MSERFVWADADDMKDLSGVEQYLIGIHTLTKALAKEDMEDTLMVQLTYPEVVLLPFSLLVASRVFPELRPLAGDLSQKLHELAKAQEFLTRGSIEQSSE